MLVKMPGAGRRLQLQAALGGKRLHLPCSHTLAHRSGLKISIEIENFERDLNGALRKGPPFHGSRSSREIKTQNASCQMGGREVTR